MPKKVALHMSLGRVSEPRVPLPPALLNEGVSGRAPLAEGIWPRTAPSHLPHPVTERQRLARFGAELAPPRRDEAISCSPCWAHSFASSSVRSSLQNAPPSGLVMHSRGQTSYALSWQSEASSLSSARGFHPESARLSWQHERRPFSSRGTAGELRQFVALGASLGRRPM